jgi:diguanylate cyclase (GGDEF)-like protein
VRQKLTLAELMAHPAVPFTGIGVIAFSATFLRTSGTHWQLVSIAALFVAAVAGIALALPWDRLPASTLLALPLGVDVEIALLRHAQDGAVSGYSPLAILPVVWVGLTLGRRATLAMAVCTGALFAVPIFVLGGANYPYTGLRGAVLWLVVAAVVGMAANRVIANQRHHASLARRRAFELQELAKIQNTLAGAHLDLDGVMAVVVEEARSLTHADGAVVELPEGDEIVYRAVAGAAEPYAQMRLRADSTISGESMRRRETLVCDDSETDPRVDRQSCRRVGARSLVVVPLVHDGRATGVLKVYAQEPGAFTADTANLLSALANPIGSAIARAELLNQLREQAATDELTGLPNRRAWYEHLALALGRTRRSGRPLTVIVLDLDGLKDVNDLQGHAAGDRLLVEAASLWPAVLRETDLLARTGGDEFVVLLEDTSEAEAYDILDRLQRVPLGKFTASGGVATWDGDEHVDELMRRADELMYAQKTARH